MTRTHHRRLLAGAAAASLALGLVAAEEDEAVGTVAFEQLDVVVGKGSIEVTGTAVFGGEELVVGSDPAADGGPVGVGTDVGELRISQDPDSGAIDFAMDVDLAAGATSPTVVWSWPLGGSSLEQAQLLAFATDPSGAPGSISFGLGTGGGVNESFSVADVSGRVEGSTLIWTLDPGQVGIDPGTAVTASDPIRTTTGNRNAAFVAIAGSPNFDTAELVTGFGVGGGARVEILDAEGEEVDAGTAKLRRGVFSRTFTGLPAGTYTVRVTTRYADARAVKDFKVKVA